MVPPRSPFYTYASGRASPYGALGICLLGGLHGHCWHLLSLKSALCQTAWSLLVQALHPLARLGCRDPPTLRITQLLFPPARLPAGEQTLALLRSLVAAGGLDCLRYAGALWEAFGPGFGGYRWAGSPPYGLLFQPRAKPWSAHQGQSPSPLPPSLHPGGCHHAHLRRTTSSPHTLRLLAGTSPRRPSSGATLPACCRPPPARPPTARPTPSRGCRRWWRSTQGTPGWARWSRP